MQRQQNYTQSSAGLRPSAESETWTQLPKRGLQKYHIIRHGRLWCMEGVAPYSMLAQSNKGKCRAYSHPLSVSDSVFVHHLTRPSTALGLHSSYIISLIRLSLIITGKARPVISASEGQGQHDYPVLCIADQFKLPHPRPISCRESSN